MTTMAQALASAVGASELSNLLESDKFGIVSVKSFGAVGDGVTDDTASIQAAIDYITAEQYKKGSAVIYFPIPSAFYKITNSLDLTEVWNITLMSNSNYGYQRQSSPDVDSDYALLHWYGGASPMIICDYSYGVNFTNITLNGRNTATVGFQIHPTAIQASNNKFIRFDNCLAKYCIFGYDIGETSEQTDDCPITMYSCNAIKNKDIGFRINSGNDCVKFFGGVASENGTTPDGSTGSNIHIVSGEVSFYGFTTDGIPSTSDIKIDGGGLTCIDFWSDVSQGLFLTGSGSTISRMSLTGVRHYDSNMSDANTPTSIDYSGKAPLVLSGCYLYNDVLVNSGNQTHIIDIGTQFVESSATFKGTMVTTYRGLISLGKVGSSEAQLSLGKPTRTDIGSYMPNTIWSDNLKTNTVKSTLTDFVVTDMLNSGANDYYLLGNAYYDGAWKAVKAGSCWQIKFTKGSSGADNFIISTTTAANAGDTITWVARFSNGEFYNGAYAQIGDTNKIIFNSSAPSQNAWKQGDVCWNSGAAVGQPIGWRCTMAGTPGTWVAMANL